MSYLLRSRGQFVARFCAGFTWQRQHFLPSAPLRSIAVLVTAAAGVAGIATGQDAPLNYTRVLVPPQAWGNGYDLPAGKAKLIGHP